MVEDGLWEEDVWGIGHGDKRTESGERKEGVGEYLYDIVTEKIRASMRRTENLPQIYPNLRLGLGFHARIPKEYR